MIITNILYYTGLLKTLFQYKLLFFRDELLTIIHQYDMRFDNESDSNFYPVY